MVEGPPWLTQHHEIWELLGYLPYPNLGIFVLELYKLTRICALLVWECLRVIILVSSFFKQPFRTVDLTPIEGLLYIYYAVKRNFAFMLPLIFLDLVK